MKDVDLDVALGQRSRPMRRILGMVLVGVLVLVTISGVIATVNPGVPATLSAVLYGTPTPTATIGPGGNVAYYENEAPWGTLTVDGRSVAVNVTPKPIFLDRGRHTLVYRADPFPPLRCTISVPAAASDTCPLDATFASRFGQPMIGSRAVDLGSTLERLPVAQRDALIALVRGQVEYTSPVTTVRQGEHYRGIDKGRITLETATQPLTVTIQIRLRGANEHTQFNPGTAMSIDCVVVCLPPLNSSMRYPRTAFPDLLEVWANVNTGYHYITQDGRVVLDSAPLGQGALQMLWSPDDLIPVFVGWNGTWQVTHPSGADDILYEATRIPCAHGEDDLSLGAGNGTNPAYVLTGSRTAPNLTDGCLITARQTSDAATGGTSILFLERFGALLAVGNAAHQLRPDFPMANQAEAAEAYAIAALPLQP